MLGSQSLEAAFLVPLFLEGFPFPFDLPYETSIAIVIMDLSIEVIVTGTSVKLILSWNLATINVVKQMLSPRSDWRERMFWLS